MERVNYEPSEVLISLREPYNKNTIWIYPGEDNIEIKIFNKGWKVIAQTKDLGLSKKSIEQIEIFNKDLKDTITNILKKHFGKFSSDNLQMLKRIQYLEGRIKQLEDKYNKLNKKYSVLLRNG